MGWYSETQLQGLVLLALILGILMYIRFLRRFRKPPQGVIPEAKPSKMTDSELDRYARHIVLREIGGVGQNKLRNAKVLVIGAGGLGAPVLQYLAAAGVGEIGIIDDDVVSVSNLQRQVIFRDDDLDSPKVFAAQKHLIAQNPYVEIRPYNRRLTSEIATDLFGDYDLVIDGCDNFETRALVNETCVALGIPFVSGAITQWEGQISVFNAKPNSPCYACVFPNEPSDGLAPSCAEAGVIGALPGVIGSMMAVEAIKYITGAGSTLSGQMMIYDGLFGESRTIKLQRSETCEVCSGN